MAMTVLEATIEIVKALVQPGGASTGVSGHFLTSEDNRKKFLEGVEEIYKTIDRLEDQ